MRCGWQSMMWCGIQTHGLASTQTQKYDGRNMSLKDYVMDKYAKVYKGSTGKAPTTSIIPEIERHQEMKAEIDAAYRHRPKKATTHKGGSGGGGGGMLDSFGAWSRNVQGNFNTGMGNMGNFGGGMDGFNLGGGASSPKKRHKTRKRARTSSRSNQPRIVIYR
jgi:hypothetical protein